MSCRLPLSYIDNSLRNDKEFILNIYKNKISSPYVGHIGPELLKDYNFILYLMKEYRDYSDIRTLPMEISNSQDFMLQAVKENGIALLYNFNMIKKTDIIHIALENGYPISEFQKNIKSY